MGVKPTAINQGDERMKIKQYTANTINITTNKTTEEVVTGGITPFYYQEKGGERRIIERWLIIFNRNNLPTFAEIDIETVKEGNDIDIT